MSEPVPIPRPRRLVVDWRILAAAVVVIGACAIVAAFQMRQARLRRLILATPAATVAAHPELVRFAVSEARPLFARQCASCHGADLKGRIETGAPNLTDRVWLYGDGGVFDIERTILYGIRSEQKKSHNITEMPAFGQRGQLSEADINNVVQYLLALNGRPHDIEAADFGRAVFTGPASCNDCHAADAKGNSDYGATDLTANVWDYGGSPRQLHDSIYFGRHGVMPGWAGKLTLEQIRALAIYVHAASHR